MAAGIGGSIPPYERRHPVKARADLLLSNRLRRAARR